MGLQRLAAELLLLEAKCERIYQLDHLTAADTPHNLCSRMER